MCQLYRRIRGFDLCAYVYVYLSNKKRAGLQLQESQLVVKLVLVDVVFAKEVGVCA